MAKFSRFDPSNKKRSKDKYQQRDKDYRFEREERESRNHYNSHQLIRTAEVEYQISKNKRLTDA